MKEYKFDLLKLLFTLCVLLPISVLLCGFVIAYGWNNILATIVGLPNITIVQAIGLDVVVTFIVTDGQFSDSPSLTELIARTIVRPLLTLLILWIITLFL